MVNATENITIFNLRYDSTTRRETFVQTNISGASYYRVAGTSSNVGGTSNVGGVDRKEDITYQIRIPVTAVIQDGREYIDEERYKAISDEDAVNYWTIQKGCYIILGSMFTADKWKWDEFNFETGVITNAEIEEIRSLRAQDGGFVTVLEYADNTRRGSDAVRHWRIGGA